MSTDNEREQVQKLRKLAVEEEKAAVESWRRAGEANWEYAKHAAAIHSQGLFSYLGHETFDLWAEHNGWERSTCRMWVRRYEELSKTFAHAQIKKLSGQNAERLLDLPAKNRTEAMLVKAQEKKSAEFTEIVQRVLQKAAPADEPARELKVPLKINTSTSQKKFVDQSMHDFAKKKGLESETPARILELMVAETVASELSDAQLLVAYLIPELRAAVELIEDKEHDPEWRCQQCGIRLRRAFDAVLKPQTIIKRAKEEGEQQERVLSPEESAENAKHFFKTATT